MKYDWKLLPCVYFTKSKDLGFLTWWGKHGGGSTRFFSTRDNSARGANIWILNLFHWLLKTNWPTSTESRHIWILLGLNRKLLYSFSNNLGFLHQTIYIFFWMLGNINICDISQISNKVGIICKLWLTLKDENFALPFFILCSFNIVISYLFNLTLID